MGRAIMKEYNIEFPRGDYKIILFSIKKNGELVKLSENDLLFMSVKERESRKEYVFQKTLNDGIKYNEDTKKYEIEINYKDTIDCPSKEMQYDITVYYDGNKPKQLVKGKFILGTKFTVNEVS
mgnify:CR=1 FL=1